MSRLSVQVDITTLRSKVSPLRGEPIQGASGVFMNILLTVVPLGKLTHPLVISLVLEYLVGFNWLNPHIESLACGL